jgi:hypothetical protein
MRRAVLVAAAAATALALAGPSPGAVAQVSVVADATVLRVDGASIVQLLQLPGVRSLATAGGAALLAHPERLDAELAAAVDTPRLTVVVEDLGTGPPALSALAARLSELRADPRVAADGIWVVSDGSTLDRDDLGAVVAAVPALWAPDSSPRALTSDSTRRDGVIVSEDLLETMCGAAFVPCATRGFDVEPVDAPPPLDLYSRYLANRRMSVPVQTAAGIFVTLAGLLGTALLIRRERVPPWLSSAGAWLAISVVPLAVSLLLVGHLGSLTYASVLTTAIAGTVAGCVVASVVARRWGATAALAALGAGTIALFVLEAALGWTAALSTFLGGTELDGGRFYGLPNVDIGLLLGAGVFVAQRWARTAAGVALLGALAVFAGVPFGGANLGAAVTLGAGAGLWWGLRGGRGGWAVASAAVGGAAAGGAVTLLANAVLPGAPTHITTFVQDGGDGIVGTVLHRLGTGLDLIARNPFALAPVIGIPLTLLAVLRPIAPIRESFERHSGWRQALLTILWGGVVAYLANDTGAAALGLAFGTALAGLLFVSLRGRPGMMRAS